MPLSGASQEQIEQFASQEQIEQFEISPTLPWRGLTPPFLDHSPGPYWEPVFVEEDETENYEISTPEPEMFLAVPSTSTELDGMAAEVATAKLRVAEQELAQAEEAKKGARLNKEAEDLLAIQLEQTRLFAEALASARAAVLEEDVAAAAREALAAPVGLGDGEDEDLNVSISAAASESGASVGAVQPSQKKQRTARTRKTGLEE